MKLAEKLRRLLNERKHQQPLTLLYQQSKQSIQKWKSHQLPSLCEQHNSNIVVKSPFYEHTKNQNGPCQCPYHRMKRQKDIKKIVKSPKPQIPAVQKPKFNRQTRRSVQLQNTLHSQFLRKRTGRITDKDGHQGVNINKMPSLNLHKLSQNQNTHSRVKPITYDDIHNIQFEDILKHRLDKLEDGGMIYKIMNYIRKRVQNEPDYLKESRILIFNHLLPIVHKIGGLNCIQNVQNDPHKMQAIAKIVNSYGNNLQGKFVDGIQQVLKDMAGDINHEHKQMNQHQNQLNYTECNKQGGMQNIHSKQKEDNELLTKKEAHNNSLVNTNVSINNSNLNNSMSNSSNKIPNINNSNNSDKQNMINSHIKTDKSQSRIIQELQNQDLNLYDYGSNRQSILLKQIGRGSKQRGSQKNSDYINQQNTRQSVKGVGRQSKRSIISNKHSYNFDDLLYQPGHTTTKNTHFNSQQAVIQLNKKAKISQRTTMKRKQDFMLEMDNGIAHEKITGALENKRNIRSTHDKINKTADFLQLSKHPKSKSRGTKKINSNRQSVSRPRPKRNDSKFKKMTFCSKQQLQQLLNEIQSGSTDRLRKAFLILLRVLKYTPQKFVNALEQLQVYLQKQDKQQLLKLYEHWQFCELIKKLVKQADTCLEQLKSDQVERVNWQAEESINFSQRKQAKIPTVGFEVQSEETSNKYREIIDNALKMHGKAHAQLQQMQKVAESVIEQVEDVVQQKNLGEAYVEQLKQEYYKVEKLPLISKNSVSKNRYSELGVDRCNYRSNNVLVDESKHRKILRFMKKNHPIAFGEIYQQMYYRNHCGQQMQAK